MSLLFSTITTEAQVVEDTNQITLNYHKQLFAESLSLVKITKSKSLIQQNPFEPINGYRLEIISNKDEILKSMKFSVPIGTVMLKGFGNTNTQGSANNLNFTISVPHFSNEKTINIYDKDNNKVLDIPLTISSKISSSKIPQPIKELKPSIAVKSADTQPNKNLNWFYTALPLAIVFGLLTYIELKRRNEHTKLMRERKQQELAALKNYVITNLRKGYSKEQIRNAMIKNKYSNKEIEEAVKNHQS